MNPSLQNLNIQTPEELDFCATVLGIDKQQLQQQLQLANPDSHSQFDEQTLADTAFDWKSNWDWSITKLLSQLPVGPIDDSPNAPWQTLSQGGGKRIDQAMVHKHQAGNVLLSEPVEIGKVLYFNVSTTTTEIHFDHSSDHVQGMLIMEALRQTGLATAHFYGVPFSSQVTLTGFNFAFHNVVDDQYPILIRLVSNLSVNLTSKIGGWGAFELIQAGESCVTGGWEGHFVPERIWQRIRERSRRKVTENLESAIA